MRCVAPDVLAAASLFLGVAEVILIAWISVGTLRSQGADYKRNFIAASAISRIRRPDQPQQSRKSRYCVSMVTCAPSPKRVRMIL
jgi:hypothetical protein